MKLGLITDIHEQVGCLRVALDELQIRGAHQIVVIGDVFSTGQQIEETVDLLSRVKAVGVWGNHDFGLCRQLSADTRARYARSVVGFMTSLQPRLTIDDCHFTHVEPWLDPNNLADLWYFDGIPNDPEKLARSFSAVPYRVMMVGHFHQWQLATRTGPVAWHGERPITLARNERFFVVVAALCDGNFAMYDTISCELQPFNIAPQS